MTFIVVTPAFYGAQNGYTTCMIVPGRNILEGCCGWRSCLTIVVGSSPAMSSIVIFECACMVVTRTDLDVVPCFFGYGLSPIALPPALNIAIHIKRTRVVPTRIKLRILDVWWSGLSKVTGSPTRYIVSRVYSTPVMTGYI